MSRFHPYSRRSPATDRIDHVIRDGDPRPPLDLPGRARARPAGPVELEGLCDAIRYWVPAMTASVVTPLPEEGAPYLRLAYQHRDGFIVWEKETQTYRWRTTNEVAGTYLQARKVAWAVADRMGAPVITR